MGTKVKEESHTVLSDIETPELLITADPEADRYIRYRYPFIECIYSKGRAKLCVTM